MDTKTVFALFYAILFGGILTRLSAWSAFWRDTKDEPARKWVCRVLWSFFWFTLVPAAYLGIALFLLDEKQIPRREGLATIPGLAIFMAWAVLVFVSVLFLAACYRFWAAIVIELDIAPKRDDLEKYVKLGPMNYFWSGIFPLLISWVGLGLLAFGF